MKPTFNPKVTFNDFPKPGQPFSAQFVKNYAEFIRQTYQTLTGQVTFGDNFNAQVISVTLAHGVQATIANPFDGVPTNCIVLGCSNGMSVVGNPSLTSLGNGLLGVTAKYAVPANNILTTNRVRSAAVAITTVTTANVCSPSSISPENGVWEISAAVGFLPSSTVTFMLAGISKTSATRASSDFACVPTNGETEVAFGQSTTIGSGETSIIVPAYTASFTALTPIYLWAQSSFSGTCSVFGSISARQVDWTSSTSTAVNLLLLNGA